MCSNRGIADRIECCMDDLVECFEDYITKSLIAIWLALGIIVASVVYLLKIVSERTLESSPSTSSIRLQRNQDRNIRSNRQERGRQGRRKIQESQSRPRRDIVKENYLMIGNQDAQISSTDLGRAHSVPSFDENVLREVGLSCCSKPCCLSKNKSKELRQSKTDQQSQISQDIGPRSRISIPVAQRSLNSPKRSLQSLPICPKSSSKGSCCSMCVESEPR